MTDHSDVLIEGLIVFGSIVTTYITVKYKNKILYRNRVAPPKDRMEQIFEGYEKLIIQQQHDIERKTSIIGSLESIVSKLQSDLNHTRILLGQARNELRESTEQTRELQVQLKTLKRDNAHINDNGKAEPPVVQST